MKQHFRNKGFTLLELILVVGIIGILAAIAFSFYGDNVLSSNRTEARSALTQTAASLEKCKSLYGAYNSGNCNVTVAFNSETGLYSIAQTTLTATQFTLTATPQGGQASDAECNVLSLTNTGLKSANGSTPNDCW